MAPESAGEDDEVILDDAPQGHGERILFVDDEESIIDVAEKLLARQGYKVVSATASQEALAMFRANPQSFDLVITDQTMPRLTGLDMAREILRMRPDVPIIMCTGYSEKVSDEIAREAGVRRLLHKPVLGPVFAQAIEGVLSQRA